MRSEYAVAFVVVCVVVILCSVIGGHLYGRFLAARDLGGRDAAIEQLRAESQKQKRDIDGKSAQITELERNLSDTRAALESILPQRDTYSILPNQTLLVAGGRLMLGLIGSPANEGVVLNINGKEQKVTAGQAIAAAPDAATRCQVSVQSFDMFKALVHVACAGANPQ